MIAVHLQDGSISVRKATRPKRPEGHALIHLLRGGICNTDIELLNGYYGFRGTPGHEFVGVVAESDDQHWVGKTVVGEINLACGKCEWCLQKLGRHCPNRTVLGIQAQHGAFREYFTLPQVNLHEVPAKIPIEHAVFAEPLAAACEILDQVKIPRSATVAVLGDGKLGLLAAQVLALHGSTVHLYGRHQRKLDIAAKLGVEGRIVSTPPASEYEYVVEATGSADGLRDAVKMTRPRGTVVLKSTVNGVVALDTAPVVVNEITLLGSRCGRFEVALKLLSTGKLALDDMVDERFPLEDAVRAFEKAQEHGVLKVLLHNGGV
jgi:threonine dehydrogenase-like Zn-dependent dehydrogenase